MTNVGGLLDIETTAQQLAQKLAESLPVTIASVALWDRPSFSLTIKAIGTARPLDVPLPLWSRVSLATAPTHRAAFQHREPVLLDLETAGQVSVQDEVSRALVPDLRAIYLLPLRVGDEMVGILGLGEMRSAARAPMGTEKLARCRAIVDEFLGRLSHDWEAGQLRQQVRAMASLLRMVREAFDARSSEDVLTMCATEAAGWLGVPVRALLFRVDAAGGIVLAARYRFPDPATAEDAGQIMLALVRSGAPAGWPVGVVSVADDLLDPLHGTMATGGRWTRITLPLMNAGRLLGLICLYVEEELQLAEWELEAFRHRAEIASNTLALVSTLEDRAHEQEWVGRAAYETLSTNHRRALREALKGVDHLVGTLLPDRIQRLVTEGSPSGFPGTAEAGALAEAVTREVTAVLESLRGEDTRSLKTSWEVDLNVAVRRVTSMARASLELPTDPARGPIRLRLELMTEPLVVRTSPELVAALVYAIENAVESMPAGGDIHVRTGRDNGHAVISVQDSGPGAGVPDDELHGLGLSVIRGVVSQQGGVASLVSLAEGATLLQIRLPLASGTKGHASEES